MGLDNDETKRRFVAVLIGSFIYAFVALSLITVGVEQAIGTLWTLVFTGLISGVLTFFVSYLVVFRYWDWVYRNRTKVVSIVIILVIILLSQIGRVVR